jgi:hypothetical protein
MRRREFALFGSLAAGWPLDANAQTSKLPTIGYLGGGRVTFGPWTAVSDDIGQSTQSDANDPEQTSD